MAGEYRLTQYLSQINADWVEAIRDGSLRIARTDQPMSRVTKRPELAEPMAAEYERVGLQQYADGLRSGLYMPIIVFTGREVERVWRPGELFLTS